MSVNIIENPLSFYHDSKGKSIDDGYIYIGTENLDPETNQITVYWDRDFSIIAEQPIRTINGFPSYNGTPARIYTTVTEYSITVKNKNGEPQYFLSSTAANKVDETVASMEELLDVPTSKVETAIITGFYSTSYNGNGYFKWNESGNKNTHNGITLIDPDHSVTPGSSGWWTDENIGTGIWERVGNEESVNVFIAGAKGDDSNDDTDAIQATIEYVESLGGGVVYIPTGTFKTTSALEVSNKYLSMRGDGGDASIISALSCNGINFVSATYDNGICFFEDFALVGRSGSAANYAAVQSILPPGGASGTDSRDGLNFYRLKIYDWNQGFIITDTWEWTIEKCKVEKVNQVVALGDYSLVGRITDNMCVFNSGDSHGGTATVRAVSFDGSTHEGVYITGNQFYAFTTAIFCPIGVHMVFNNNDIFALTGIYLGAITGCTVKNNYIQVNGTDAKAIYGIGQASETSVNYVIDGNEILSGAGTTTYGIQINDVGTSNNWHWRIINNNISGFTSGDIISFNSGDLVITGNRCRSAIAYNINVTNINSARPCYIKENFCAGGINYTATDVTNGYLMLGRNYANSAYVHGDGFYNNMTLDGAIDSGGNATIGGYGKIAGYVGAEVKAEYLTASQTMTMATVLATREIYLLTCYVEQGTDVGSDDGLYLIRRQGTQTLVTPIVTSTNLTPSVNGSYQVILDLAAINGVVFGALLKLGFG